MIKQIAGSLREYKKHAILTPLLVTLEVVLECAIPFIIALLVNQVKDGTNINLVYQYGLILIIMALLSLLFGSLAGMTCSIASCGLAKNLRQDMFYSIQNYSFENIDKFMTSSLVTRMTTDIMFVQFAFMMIIRIAIRSPLMLIFAFVMSFLMGGKMAWIFLFVLPFLSFCLFLIIRKVIPLFKSVFKKYDVLNQSIQENIKGIRVVKTFVREDYEKEKLTKAATDISMDFTRIERILALNNPLMQFCIYAVVVFVLSFGSYTIITTKGLALNVGHISSLMAYSFMMLSSLMMFSMVFAACTMAGASGKRICEVLNEKSLLLNPDNPIYEVKDGSIDFNNVNFKYSKSAVKNVLENIDLHIKSGETIGIIGGTGSSKSSLIQLIPRLYDVSDGSVLVGGIDVKNYDIETLRDQVAIVLQKNVLFSGTINENLRWGNPNATDQEIQLAAKLSCADEFVSGFKDGYETYLEQGGMNLSGGQKQRLCIARALLKKPKILIMDDSTSAVDTKTDAKIRKAMREYIPDTTKIIIAQRIVSIEDADRIIVLESGKIQAIGNHEELLRDNETYRDLYESQSKVGEQLGE